MPVPWDVLLPISPQRFAALSPDFQAVLEALSDDDQRRISVRSTIP
jgi:hypothetical protein